ncbi:hypothetical protein KIN20_008025 [Parelaphostrongylus tenuis]|nr:hypothetical protein KIN20_008025 [Parelaphostrongylus tenuis]
MFFKRPNAVEFNETELRKAIEKYDINMATKPIIIPEKRWNMWGGLYYAGTLYTTIGYGDMAAETVWGRIFTIVYAIVGIPLMIIILNDWGTGMFHAVDLVWKKQFNFVVHRTKSLFHSKYRDGSKESFCNSSVSQVSKENPPNNPDRSEPIPLCLVAFVLIFWIVLCSAVFLFFENWTFFESLYFFFISLTTIGLGDFTLSSNAAVANFLPILIGLSVGSMAVNVIQMQLEILFTKIAELIDFDFKVNLSKSGEGDDVQPALSTTPSRKDNDVVKQYRSTMTTADKFLLRFLSNHQIKELNEKFDKRAKMRNKGTQTKSQIGQPVFKRNTTNYRLFPR